MKLYFASAILSLSFASTSFAHSGSPLNCVPSGQMGTEFLESAHRGKVVLDCTSVTYLLCEDTVVCCSLSDSALDTRVDYDRCAKISWLNPGK